MALLTQNVSMAFQKGAAGPGGGGGGVLPIMAYTRRLCPKGVPFSCYRYRKELGSHESKYMKG